MFHILAFSRTFLRTLIFLFFKSLSVGQILGTFLYLCTNMSHLSLTLPVRIRQMPAELLQFPVQALKVKVAGLKPPSASLEEDVLPYSPEWSVRAVMEMVDLLHTNITASVVVRKSAPLRCLPRAQKLFLCWHAFAICRSVNIMQ